MQEPTLRAFLFRAHALSLYRDFLRVVRKAPPESRSALVAHIRQEFRSASPASDHDHKHLLRVGREQLKRLDESLGLATATL